MRRTSHILIVTFFVLTLICPLSFSFLTLGDKKVVFSVLLVPFLPVLVISGVFHLVISKKRYSAMWTIVPSVVGCVPLVLLSCLTFFVERHGEKLRGGGAGVALYFPVAVAVIASVAFVATAFFCFIWHFGRSRDPENKPI
jgi:hypothetical protein